MPSPGRDPRVFRAQLELFHRLSERSLVAAFVFSTVLAVFYPDPDRQRYAFLWWLILNASGVVRIYLGRQFIAGKGPRWSLDQWARDAVLGALVSGSLWGYFVAALGPSWGDVAYPIAVFIAAGVPAVSITSNTAILAAYVALVVPILIPHALQLVFWGGGSTFELLGGVAIVIYLAVFIGIATAINARIVEAFELRFSNLDLVERLKTSNKELAEEIVRREQTEHGLREATGAAESANLAKSRFLARMSHEIRTPLNGILGMTEILQQTSLSPQQTQHAETIDEAGRSLLRVINDILDFSRVEAGKLPLQFSDFSVREAVDRCVAILRPRALARGLRIEAEIADTVPAMVRGDSGRLRQVLLNLAGNAVKFTEAGEVRVRVFRPEAAVDAFDLAFEVTDTGIGIAPDQQDRLFEPFAQSDESVARQHGGTGLGLAISRQLVELMNGTIGFSSVRGSGSTFWFTARFTPPWEVAKLSASPGLSAQDLKGSLRGHVLLVDDNAVNRLIAGEYLKILGCTFVEAHDGAEALRLVARDDFDLVLMDCEMPLLDGYGASAQIRKSEEGAGPSRALPIVAITASALEADRDRALAAGMNDYVSKPFSLRDLHQVMAPFLEDPRSALAPPGGSPTGVPEGVARH